MRTFWSKSNTVSAIPVFILCTHTTNVKLALAQRGAHRDHNSTCALVLSEYRTCKMSIYAQQKHSSSYSRGLRLEGGNISTPCVPPSSACRPQHLQRSQGRVSFMLATSTALMLCFPRGWFAGHQDHVSCPLQSLVSRAAGRQCVQSEEGSHPARFFPSSLQRLEPCRPDLFFCLLMSLPLGRAGELSSMAHMVSPGFS